jgi:Tol biopolymer transport system component
MGDARIQIEEAIAGRAAPESGPLPVTTATNPPPRRPVWQLAAGAIILTGAAAAAAAAWFANPAPAPSALRLSIALLPGQLVTTAPAISADGQTVAYAAGRTPVSAQLYLRSLTEDAPRVVASSTGAQYPFFSPDGRSIAFFAGGKLRRASTAGGAAADIAAAPAPWGGTWDADGKIIFTTGLGSGLWRVGAEGGTPEQLTKPDGAGSGYAHVFPQRLPGTRDVLFGFWGQTFYAATLSLDTRTWREVTVPSRSLAGVSIFVPGGFLVGNDGAGNVVGAPWTPALTSPVAPEAPVIEDVFWVIASERSWVAAADNGTAVYVPGNPTVRRLVWVNRRGEATSIPGEAAAISQATLSRDGKRVVYGGLRSQWIVDLQTGATTRLSSDVRSWTGGWLPGDERIVFSSNKDGDWDLFTLRSDGSDITPLLRRPFAQHAQAIAKDGTIVFLERHPATGNDLWRLSPGGEVSPLVVTPSNEISASISADGRYVAYVSDAPGRDEVFAMAMTGKGDRIAVSINGGTGPVWSGDGRELFYRAGDDLMSVSVNTSGPLVLGERRRLLDLSPYDSGYFHEFDVSPDGERFLLISTEPASRPYRLNIITNWIEELRRKVS